MHSRKKKLKRIQGEVLTICSLPNPCSEPHTHMNTLLLTTTNVWNDQLHLSKKSRVETPEAHVCHRQTIQAPPIQHVTISLGADVGCSLSVPHGGCDVFWASLLSSNRGTPTHSIRKWEELSKSTKCQSTSLSEFKAWGLSTVVIIIPVLCRPVHNWRWLKALADGKNNPREDEEDTNQSGREYRTRTHSCFLGYNDGSSGFEQFLYCKVGALLNFRAWVFSTSPCLERVGTTVYRLNPIRKRINREYLFHKAPDLDCLVSRTVWSNLSPGARVYMSFAVSGEFYPHTLCYSNLLRTSRGEYYHLCCTDKKPKSRKF